jgi:hypothetical protein
MAGTLSITPRPAAASVRPAGADVFVLDAARGTLGAIYVRQVNVAALAFVDDRTLDIVGETAWSSARPAANGRCDSSGEASRAPATSATLANNQTRT